MDTPSQWFSAHYARILTSAMKLTHLRSIIRRHVASPYDHDGETATLLRAIERVRPRALDEDAAGARAVLRAQARAWQQRVLKSRDMLDGPPQALGAVSEAVRIALDLAASTVPVTYVGTVWTEWGKVAPLIRVGGGGEYLEFYRTSWRSTNEFMIARTGLSLARYVDFTHLNYVSKVSGGST